VVFGEERAKTRATTNGIDQLGDEEQQTGNGESLLPGVRGGGEAFGDGDGKVNGEWS